jgi:hypothetical protein
MATKEGPFSSACTENVTKNKEMSPYLRDLIREVECHITHTNHELSNLYDLILPASCSPFDVDIAQKLMTTNCSSYPRKEFLLSSDASPVEFFKNLVWDSTLGWQHFKHSSSSSSSMSSDDCQRIRIAGQLSRFADIHFQSAEKVTAMNELDLGCLALWLSWYPSFFSDDKEIDIINNDNDNANSRNNGIVNDTDKDTNLNTWHWNQYKDLVVSGLLNVLFSRTHDPKCLSIAVACLSFLVEQHSASDSVLTDTNISQLLRLCLSKAIYPTIEPATTPFQTAMLVPQWEITFCRIGLRRMLSIPKGTESN